MTEQIIYDEGSFIDIENKADLRSTRTFPLSTTMQELEDWANENCTQIIRIIFKDKITEVEYRKK